MKRYGHLLALALLIAAPATARAQDAMSVLNQAAKAMHIETMHTVRYTATGSAYSIGQSFTPGGPYPRSSMEFTRELDLDAFTGRQTFINTRVDDRGGGLPSRVGTRVTQGPQNLSRTQPWPRHVFMWLTPVGFIKEAMKHDPKLTTRRVGGKRFDVVTVKADDTHTLVGLFDERHLLTKVETVLANNPTLGNDVPLDSLFTGYRDFSGVVFPSRIVHYLGSQPSFDFSITSVTPNVALDTSPNPTGDVAPDAPQTVTSQAVGKGVYYLTGGTHHSVAVEFADHTVVIDAPLSEARSLAVMAEVKKLIPNKPIRFVINTHHHFDHSNGLRTYAAEGVTIVTHPRNAAFYRQWWSRPSVVTQDNLSRSGKKAVFQMVSDHAVMRDQGQTLEMYVVRNTPHVEGMLMVYLPKEKLLVEPDLYTPPAAGAAPVPDDPWTPSLVANIKRLKLDVQRIVPLHGSRVASRADLDLAASAH